MSHPTRMAPTYGIPQSPGVVQRPLPVSRSGTEFILGSFGGSTGATTYFSSEVNQLQFTPPPASFVGRNRSELINRRFLKW